jgi:hypothetical protein
MMHQEVEVNVDDILAKKRRSCASIEETIWEATKIPTETESCKMLIRGKDEKIAMFHSKWLRNRSWSR